MYHLGVVPQQYVGLFEKILDQSGPWLAGAAGVAGILLVLIRGGIIPLWRAKTDNFKDRAATEEELSKGAHNRKMRELEVQKEVNEGLAVTSANMARSAEKAAESMATAERMQEGGLSAMKLADKFVQRLVTAVERAERGAERSEP